MMKEYREGYYFLLPNQIFNLDLQAGEIAIYSYLMFRENRKTYQCYPSYKTIGKAVKLSENTVRKYIKGLESKALIYTEHTMVRPKHGFPRNGNLRYTIRPIQDAVDHYHARQMAVLDSVREQMEFEQRVEEYNRSHPDKPVVITTDEREEVTATP